MLHATTNPFLKEVLDRALTSSQASSAGKADPAASAVVKKAQGQSKKPTLGSIFKSSLIQLKETIDATNAHYIRCIKPNEAKTAWEFDPPMVLAQLKACGVLETIRISCAGYPTRWTYEEFAERYYMLTPSANWGPDLKHLCSLVLQATIQEEDKYQAGLTKIFFRAGMLAYLERLRTDRLNALVTLMQKNALRFLHQTRYQRLRRATIGTQCMWRRTLARREAERRRKEAAATGIQKVVRGYLQRKQYVRTQKAVVTLQAGKRSGSHTYSRLCADARPQHFVAAMLVWHTESNARSLLLFGCRHSGAVQARVRNTRKSASPSLSCNRPSDGGKLAINSRRYESLLDQLRISRKYRTSSKTRSWN